MPIFPTRYVNLARARELYGDRVDRLGHHLTKSDDLADEVITSFASLARGEGWRLFERALRGDVAAAAPAPLCRLIEEAAHVPAWLDWRTADKGGELLMRSGALGGAVLGARSLVLGYASPGGNKPLVMSGRLVEQANRRLNETARFVQAVCRPSGMRPFAEGWQITLKVRLIHAQVRKMILSSGKWRTADWGLPANQHDLAGTTLLFSASIIDGLRALGMQVSSAEAESYIHLWRWVGRVIGVDADVLPASEPEAMRLADLIETTMGEPDQDSRDLTKALFDAGVKDARSARELRAAKRAQVFGWLICRELVGDDLADKLGVPRQTARFAMPLVKRFIGAVEKATRVVPFGERSAVAAGMHYWDRVVEIGLRGATYDFPLPVSLGNLAA
ncbi:MAG: DUF2236 domain-containing protein [Labilithrix sp.]|nr:DUF2236 domain-containing protein [Labilithrix sp.]MCW5811406.1 DUF2236 domain-containing protein [Labilithrix sp.]